MEKEIQDIKILVKKKIRKARIIRMLISGISALVTVVILYFVFK